MIKRNATYGKTKNVVVVELGAGDVHMVMGEKAEDKSVHLTLRTTEPRPINITQEIEDGVTFDDLKPEIAFIFHKVESIESFINMLKDCKTEFLTEA